MGAGEATYDLILVDSGEVEVVRAATARAAEAVVARFGTGQFAGQLSLLTGHAAARCRSKTSQPLVFPIGDVRSGSMKRVAAAVGDGASAIRSVHTALGSVVS